jgi:hypothetical protein
VVFAIALAGCATMRDWEQAKPLVPSKPQARSGPFALYSNRPIAADSVALRALASLETHLDATLGLKAAAVEPPVEVYILEDRAAFTHFLTFYYPELPPRRAFFLARGVQRVVYAFENDRLEEDVRHEATHALLHATVGDLPLWLDEGLAEYFEGPEGRQGLNPEHIARLPDDLKSGWVPNLARLEALKTVQEMTPRDYREAWAWVHHLLNDSPRGKQALLHYLAAQRDEPGPSSFAELLASQESDGAAHLLAHIEQVRAAPAAAASRNAAPKIQLQDSEILTARQQPGWWERVATFLGIARR